MTLNRKTKDYEELINEIKGFFDFFLNTEKEKSEGRNNKPNKQKKN